MSRMLFVPLLGLVLVAVVATVGDNLVSAAMVNIAYIRAAESFADEVLNLSPSVEQVWQRSHQINGHNSSAHRGLAWIAMCAQDWEAATHHWRLGGVAANQIMSFGLNYRQYACVQSPLQWYSVAHSLDPLSRDPGYFSYRYHLESGAPEAALTALEESVFLPYGTHGRSTEWLNIAQLQSDFGRNEEKILNAIQKAIEIDEFDRPQQRAKAYERRSRILLKQGLVEEALVDTQKSLRSWPEYYLAWVQLGIISHHQGRITEAEAALQRAISLDPARPEAYKKLHSIYQERGSDDLAAEILHRLHELAPTE